MKRCDGFSLVECIVAMLLLSIGVLGLAGAGVTAMRALRGADRAYVAALHAAAVLDSLVLLERPAPGTQQRDGLRIDWHVSAVQFGVRIDIAVRDGGASLLADASGFAAPWPPRIGRIP